ncbi:MAG: hypothetical protein AB7V22_12060, partial [Kiritimatiellia bacterium]
QPVEYLRNALHGHVRTHGPVLLPAEAHGQEYVQLLWRYYWISGASGSRAQLRLDDLSVANRLAGFAAWQFGEFTPEELADPAISGPLAESSGVPNLLRYAFGLDRPGDYAAVRPTAHVQDNVRTFRHRALIDGESGVDYSIESATDLPLQDWTPAEIGRDLIFRSSSFNGDGLTATVEYELSDEFLPPPRQLRLRVTLTD